MISPGIAGKNVEVEVRARAGASVEGGEGNAARCGWRGVWEEVTSRYQTQDWYSQLHLPQPQLPWKCDFSEVESQCVLSSLDLCFDCAPLALRLGPAGAEIHNFRLTP